MANMSRTSSASSVQGFSILQPTLGATLSFLPAVGTKELDALVDAYLPGPASPQDKRAAVAFEFFEYSARTGENFKYFAIPVAAVNSPVGFTPSPVMSELTYASSSQASTPATPATKSSRSTKRPETADFSHLPGMKIITLDGQDVTNHVSRGCKTKEQRDHAHLMRILKACDACKKKKIRCDPSHKKRSASQAESGKSESAKPAKKSKKAPASIATPKSQSTAYTPAPDVEHGPDISASLEDFTSAMADWDQYFTFNEPIDTALSQDLYTAVPHDYNFFFEPEVQFSPATSGSSAVSPAQPLTPTGSGVSPQALVTFGDNSFTTFAPADVQEPMLPYMASGAHGSNYVDFSLYSDAASPSFSDEEPMKLMAGEKRKARNAATSPVTGLIESRSASGALNDQQDQQNQQHGFDHSPSISLSSTVPAWNAAGARHVLSGLQLPFHNDDTSHGAAHGGSVALPHGLQSPFGINSPTTSGLASLTSTSVIASASMVLEGVNPSTGSESLVRPTASRAGHRLNRPLPVSSPVCNLRPSVLLENFVLTLEKTLQVQDGQQLSSPQQTISPMITTSPSTVILSNSPGRQGQCVPADGLTSSAERPHRSFISDPQVLSVHPLPTVATGIPASTAVIATGLVRADNSLQQSAASCASANALQPCTRLTGLGSVSRGLAARSSSSLAQLPESVEPRLDAVLSLTTPLRQLLAGRTTYAVLTTQLAVFGLVSLLLIVAVTLDLQEALQLQPPVFALIPFLKTIMSSSLAALTLQHAFSEKHGVPASVNGLMSGSSLSSSRRRLRHNRSSTPCLTAPYRVMACC